MNDFINLLGADDVARAGSTMRGAAETIQQAANCIAESVEINRRTLDDFLIRLEYVLKEDREGRKEKKNENTRRLT